MRGGGAQLLLGGGISAVLLVLFMLTSFMLVRLFQIIRQHIVAELHFQCSDRHFNGNCRVCATLSVFVL